MEEEVSAVGLLRSAWPSDPAPSLNPTKQPCRLVIHWCVILSCRSEGWRGLVRTGSCRKHNGVCLSHVSHRKYSVCLPVSPLTHIARWCLSHLSAGNTVVSACLTSQQGTQWCLPVSPLRRHRKGVGLTGRTQGRLPLIWLSGLSAPCSLLMRHPVICVCVYVHVCMCVCVCVCVCVRVMKITVRRGGGIERC